MYKMFEYPKDVLLDMKNERDAGFFIFPGLPLTLVFLLLVFLKGLAADICDGLTPSTPDVGDSYNNRL